jgi:ATP-dependent Clp protease ATP-binding subunit ClpA
VFERFTNTARRAVVISQQETRALAQEQIGPLHLLLGALTAENGTAGGVLASLGVEPEDVRRAVVATYGTGDVPEGHIPFASATKKALELSLRECLGLEQAYISTEHIALGLMTEESPEVGEVLAGLGAQPQAVRDALMVRLGSAAGAEPAEP